MSGPFLALTLLAAVLIFNWRLVLLVLAAALIALVALGMGVAREAVGQPQPTEQTAPPTPH